MNNKPIYNAAFYGRYSPGPDQTEASITGQRRECYAKAKSQNAIIRKEYIDRHLTGKNDKRPAFLELIKDVKKGLYDIVYVYTIDRFSRNKFDIARYKNELKKAGTRLISAKEYIPAGPEGIILESVLEGMAEYYSEELSRKVGRGMYDAALQQHHVGGVVPFGLQVVDKKYVPHPINAPIVREIFERYAAGEAAIDICNDLNSRGITTSLGKKFKRNSLTKMLTNPKYIGTYIFNHTYLDEVTQQKQVEVLEYKNVIEPIVTEELFIKAGKRMELNKRASKPRKNKENVEFLLSGKLLCGLCNSLMTGDSGTSRSGQKYYYYTCCNKKNKTLSKKCRAKSYPKEKLERFITKITKEEVLTDKVYEFLTKNVELLQEERKDNTFILTLQKNKKEIENKIENILKAIENGIYTESTKERLETLEQTKRDIDFRIKTEKFKDDAPSVTKEALIFYLNNFKNKDISDPTFQRQIIDSFVNCIIINEKTDKILIGYNYCGENDTKELSIKNTLDVFESDYNGGPQWTRTTDLTLIRGAL